MLWHDWSEAETAVLDELLTAFHALNPEVRVVSVAVPGGTLRQRYEEAAPLGLGPDLFILSDMDLRPLAAANLIRPVPTETIDLAKFQPSALDSLRYHDSLYGLPLSLRPMALYYNTERVTSPPRTLEALLQEARAGQGVALNTQFLLSLWGLPAFGGSLFDDEGRVILNQGGYTNWLNWLKVAQDTPGMILDRNDELLRELFISRRVSYYVGGPQALPELREPMRSGTIGAVPLPSGPNGPAGPLLQAEAIFFNQASSLHQTQLAFALANFLTNAEQNAQLMRSTDRVPANRRVRVDQQAFPAISGFAAQARTAVPVPQLPQMENLVVVGEDTLRSVLTGLIDVNEAAFQLAQTVNSQMGFETQPTLAEEAPCEAAGRLTVWHAWREEAATVLGQLTADYMQQCPNASIVLRQFEADRLLEQFQGVNEETSSPDLVIGPSSWVQVLVDAEQISPISGRINANVLQQFVAPALNTLRIEGQLAGLPLVMNLPALYYNRAMVTDPARTLDDLVTEAAVGNRVALPLGFERAYWGAAAFGGSLFTNGGQLTLADSGFIAWLTWLQQVQNLPGMVLLEDDAILQVLFSSGSVAYYAGSSLRLDTLQMALGAENLGVTNLPAGPNGVAAPLLSTDAVFFPRSASQINGQLALEFALFLTAVEAQTRLMAEAYTVPANVNVDSTRFPAVTGFLNQSQTAVVWPPIYQTSTIMQSGDELYESVVLRQTPPAFAACDFAARLFLESGLASDESALPEICRAEIENGTDE